VSKTDSAGHTLATALDSTPASTWTPAYRESWRQDLRASIVVFLVALPLCLGIALASGAPLMAGVVTGIIGGIVVGVASGSHLMVSGPAAGLTAIVLSAITTLGGFPAFLTAVFLAGLMQMALGLLRAGVIGYYFPNSVIRGMLAGIGLIIILRQLPYALGADAVSAADGIAAAFAAAHTGTVIISLVALGILLLWDQKFMKPFAVVPGALIAVLVCTALNALFGPELVVQGAQLVNLPLIQSVGALDEALESPLWSALANSAVWVAALTIAIVASLETLLSLEATDRMDPLKREAPANRELFAQGIGNALCGLLGGLPMTGVIVRSSANVYAGAKTKASAIIHGVLLVVAVFTIPTLLNLIPLAVLAIVLIHTGFKLAHPRQLKNFLRQGFHQWLPFVVTIVAILVQDLLIGIAIGLAFSLFFILLEHLSAPCFETETTEANITHLRLNKHLTFLHKASITAALQAFKPGSQVIIDGSKCRHVDHDVLDVLRDFQSSARERRLDVTITGLDLNASSIGMGH
jgi:MFS superfamily sulfate permease-like transporter